MRTASVMLVMAAYLVGCGTSISYSSWSADRVLASPGDHGLVVADIMDGRRLGQPSDEPLFAGNTRSQDLAELRESVREHAVRAGLLGEGDWIAPAPESPEEAEQVMNTAAERGAKVVLFTRLEGAFASGHTATVVNVFLALNYLSMLGVGAVAVAPSLIVFSLPINSEYAAAGVRAFLVEPRSKTLITTFKETAVLDDDSVTAWGHNPVGELPDIMFEAMQRVFNRVAQVLQSGAAAAAGAESATTMLFAPQHHLLEPADAVAQIDASRSAP